MNFSWTVLIVCVIASTATAKETKSLAIEELKKALLLAPKGDIPEFADCGSLRPVLRVEIEDCDSKPCFLTTDRTYAVAISFRNVVASSSLRMKVLYFDFEMHEHTFVDSPINGSTLPETDYRVNYEIFVPTSLGGMHGFIQVQIWDDALESSVACALLLAAVSNE